jgi:hypothetical protein
VGQDVDVRATDRVDGSLILREKDHPYHCYVFVTGSPPNMLLRGYIRGWDAMVPEFYCKPEWLRCSMVRAAVSADPDPAGRTRTGIPASTSSIKQQVSEPN